MNLRDCPLPGDWTVAEGLKVYLEENAFRAEEYDAPRTPVSLLGIRFSVPNPPLHSWAIRRHDLHHVATGYGTDLRGEAEVSLWELRKGIRATGLYTSMIVVSICLLGPFLAPWRCRNAWKAGKGGPSLFRKDGPPYEEALTWTIAELREALGVPVDGLAEGTRGLHSGAPKAQVEPY